MKPIKKKIRTNQSHSGLQGHRAPLSLAPSHAPVSHAPPAASPPPPCTSPFRPRGSRALAWPSSDLDLLGPRPSASSPRRLDCIQTRSALARPSRSDSRARGGRRPEPRASGSQAHDRPCRSCPASGSGAIQVRILSSFNCISVFIFF